MRVNRSMPTSMVIPVLAYPDVAHAVRWLCDAFGFTERLRIGDHRAQLTFGDGAIVVAHQPPGRGADSGDASESRPAPGGEAGHSVMVRVEDVDRHHDQAKRHGAQIVQPPADYPYGERQYTAKDLAGCTWTFSQSIADVAPEEWGGTLVTER
ncbi:MAG: VOC family protein [bacterium]